MNRLFAFILLRFLFLFCSCVSPPSQIIQPDSPSDFTFDVTIVNNTLFDVEVMDGSRIIPKQGEKIITLPLFFGELNEGYRLTYRVPLLGDIFLRVPRQENIIIRNDQRTALVDSPDFQSDFCFLIIKNMGNQTISLKDNNEYVNSVVSFEPIEYSSSPYLGPGNSNLYELRPGQNNRSIETDQYRIVSFPLNVAVPGFIYTFIFDGNEAFPIEARPLVDIEGRAPLSISFTGDSLSETEKSSLVEALAVALENYSVPLRPVFTNEEYSSFEGRIFYTLNISLNTRIQAPQPPVNTELVRGELSLSLLRNGKVLRVVDAKNLVDLSRRGILLLASSFVREARDFYNGIKTDMSL